MSKIEARLAELGYTLPPPPPPAGNYLPATRSGNLMWLAGVGSRLPDGARISGKLGADLTVAQGYEAARWCALNLLARMKAELGDLDKVTRILKVVGMVNSAPQFYQQAQVVDGASDLFVDLFGDRGRHSRSAPGMAALPGNSAVIVECVIEVASASSRWPMNSSWKWLPLGCKQVQLVLALFTIGTGLSIVFLFFPPHWAWVQRAAPLIPADRWWRLFAIYIGWMVFGHLVITHVSHWLRGLFGLQTDLCQPGLTPEAARWPPAIVGLLESVVYPTAFVIHQPEFIAVWLALKVAGGWEGWRGATFQARNRFQLFLINSTLSLLFGGAAFLSLKALVL
jgi:enamine deaminase RidA (YjgF/YER057c/UK114 family)